MTDSDRTDWPTALAKARRERDEAQEACRLGAEALAETCFQLRRRFRCDHPAPDMGGPQPSEIPARRALKEADAALAILRIQSPDARKDRTPEQIEQIEGRRVFSVSSDFAGRWIAAASEAKRERDEARKHVQLLQDRVDDLSTQASDAVAIVAHTILSHSDLDAIPTGDLHGVDPKGIERVRASMVEAGYLPARKEPTDDR